LDFHEEMERNFYIEAVAKNYGIDVEQLRRLVNRLGSQMVGGIVETKEYQGDARNAKRSRREDGIIKSQKLMLTWLIEDNSLFDKIAGILGPEDFTEGICGEVARLVFEQYEKEHTCFPARIINRFESKEEQSEAAALFSAGIKGEMNKADWQKALSDTVQRLKEYSLRKQSEKAIAVNDTALLQKLILQQAELKKHSISIDL
jgi:DNA primase